MNRPATIAELAEVARNVNWDESGSLKYFLRIAEKERKAGAQYFEQKDLEHAFVAFARAASLILERIPNHRDYKSILSETQRSNLALNGQEILDNLGHLKPILLTRYDKWAKLHPNGESASVDELSSSMNRVDFNRDQDRLAKEELDLWRTQREQSQRRQEQEGTQRRDSALNAARRAAVGGAELPASIPQFRTPTKTPDNRSRSQEYDRFPSTSAVIMPTPSVSVVPPMDSRTPSYMERPLAMPLESPSKYDGDSTDSESVMQSNWHRRNGDRYPNSTPTRQPTRSPAFPPPITTTSPPPPEVSHIRYPQLMSPHQRTQGYFPSANSMFMPGQRPGPALASLAFEDRNSQHLYSSNLLPAPSAGVLQPTYPQMNTHPPPPPPPEPHYAPKVPPAVPAANTQHAEPSSDSSFGLKTVNLPRDSLPRFLAIANANTQLNRETCGLLLGKFKGNKYVVTTLLIPRQHSTSDTCTMDEEELVLQFTEERSLITLGWIHTHPSQSCFMSSVDLHTHSGFQRMLPESFAVVCAPKSNPKYGIFRLTDPPGLQTILSCNVTAAFHPHPDLPIYTDADKGHVQMKDIALEIVDLR